MMPFAEISFTGLYLGAICYAGSLALYFLKKTDWADILLCVAFLLHTVSQISRGWIIGIFTPIAIVEVNFFLPWCLAFLTLCLRFFTKEKQLGCSAIIPVLFFLLIALQCPKGVFPPSPQGQTIFSPLFFLFEVPAQAFFVLGAWFAFQYLRREAEAEFFDSLIIWGFIFYSIAQVAGAIWCYLGWASLFNWSERHLQSAAIWCFYAAYIHLRFLYVRDMKRKAWFSIAGFALVLLVILLGHLSEMNMPRLGG